MMYWYGDTFDLSWLLMILAMFAFWAFVIWLVANEVRGGRGHVEQAEEILTQRFARGEIDAAGVPRAPRHAGAHPPTSGVTTTHEVRGDGMRAKDAIRKSPETIEAGQTITEAAQRMDAAAVGALVVVEDGTPIGIVTDRDLVVRAMAKRYPPDSRVDGVMSMGVIAIDADADLRHAIDLFSHHAIRRLPVVENGEMCGMITVDDVVVDLAHDLDEATKPLAAQVLFGHPEPGPLARR